MPIGTLERRVRRSNSAKRSDERIGRAAKHAGWAGIALESAARDLDGACGEDGNALSGLCEVVQDAAMRISSLAEEIENRRSFAPVSQPGRVPGARRNATPQRGIIGAVTRVLTDHSEPLQAREIHARVETLLREPVRWDSVKATLAGNIQGTAPRFVRVARGRYTILGLPGASEPRTPTH